MPRLYRQRSVGIMSLILAAGMAHADTDPAAPAAASPQVQTQPGVAPMSAASESDLAVGQIQIVGNTAFDDAALRSIAAPFEGRALSDEALEDLRLRLTRHYIDAGFINSGAVIPERTTTDGALRVQVIEGHLSEVRISGPHHYRSGYLPRRIAPDPDEALNVRQLQEDMQLLLQDGVVAQINAQLKPGAAPGQSILEAFVREGPRFRARVSTSNDRPPSVGESGGMLMLSARNLIGLNDQTQVSLGFTRGYESYGIQQTMDLSSPSVSVFLKAGRSDGNIVESSIRDLDITSEQDSAELGVTGQLIHTLRRSLSLSLSSYYTDTETFLLGIPFSFSRGVEEGRSTVAGLRGAVDFTHRGASEVIAARSVLNVGLNAYGATVHESTDLPDSRFVVWNSQFQYVRLLWGRVGEFVARGGVQRASRSLLPSEKFSLGGIDTVRGYAANTLVRDQGFVGSAEYRHRLFHLRLPGISQAPGDGEFALAGFFDGGAASDRDDQRRWLTSVGAGLRWDPAPNFSAVLYRGVALRDLENEGDSLQDHGVHFQVAYEAAF